MSIYLLERKILRSSPPFGYLYETLFKYVSPLSASEAGIVEGNGYNNTQGESEPCSGLKTFEQALQYAYDLGARLPTFDEVVNNAAAASGCGYDSERIWTCTKGLDSNEHWTAIGKDGTGTGIIQTNDQTAYVRFFADIDPSRPDPVMLDDSVIKAFLNL